MAQELAAGYISLSVKYGDSMKQLNKELLGLDDTAKKAGKDAGKGFSKSMAQSAKLDASDAKGVLNPLEDEAKSAGTKAGKGFGSKLVDSAKGMFKSKSGELTEGFSGGMGGSGKEAAENFVQGFGGPIASLGTKAGPIGLALAAVGGVAFAAGSVIARQVLAGMEQEQLEANLAAKLGLSPQQAEKMGKAAGEAYVNNFGESREANLETIEVAYQAGLITDTSSQDDIQKTIEQLNTVSEITGESQLAIARSAKQLEQTGLVDNQTEAFDLMVRAQQKGLNVNEDYLDTLNEYSTQFRKLGLDGPEAFGLINQAMEGGARNSDLAADAIKEFSIRAVDGSKSTQEGFEALGLNVEETSQKFARGGEEASQAFGDVLNRLRAIEDPVKRNQVAVALFGTQAEDLGDALYAMNLGTVANEMDGLAGATQRAADTMGGTGVASFESAKRTVEVAVSDMQRQLAEVLGPALEDLANWFVEHQDDVVAFFTKIGQAALWAVESVVRFVGDVIDATADLVGAFGDIQGWVLKFEAWQADLRGDHETANELRAQSEAAFGLGEGLHDTADKWHNYADGLADARDEMGENLEQTRKTSEALRVLKEDLTTLPDGKTIVLKDNSEETKKRMEDLGFTVQRLPDGHLTIRIDYRDQNGNVINPNQLGVSQRQQSAAAGHEGPRQGFARGGIIRGPGSGTSDSILAWLSNGEGVVTAEAMRNGGAALVEALNAGWVPSAEMLHDLLPGFAQGGIAGAISFAQQFAGRRYIYGGTGPDGFDCSGFMSAIYGVLTGQDPFHRYFTTESNFEALGFQPGFQPGAFNIGISRGGGGKNSHMAGTLPNGVNVESGGNSPFAKYGGDARGAMDFPLKFFLPVTGNPLGGAFGSSWGGGGGAGSWGGGGASAKQIQGAQDKVTDLEGRLAVAEQKLKETEANPDAKESDLMSKRNDVEKHRRELGQAKQELDGLMAQGSGTGSSLSDSSNPYVRIIEAIKEILPDFGQLADIGVEGLKETLLPPGFSDPTGWGIFQAGSGILGFLASIIPDPIARGILSIGSNALGGSGSGTVNAIQSLIPAPFGDLQVGSPDLMPEDFAATQHTGSGGIPNPANLASAFTPDPAANGGGQTVNNDNSIHIGEGGQVGVDPVAMQDKSQRQQRAQQAPHLGTRRYI
ncbi:phage tail tape measure protein [Mycolicibacterium smegmatis]|uniref:phage tail tape measure protein n=1 Tax=Mycolicibacterium smegmatis TaxID=1772 RepID=UPI0005D97946|nr:phage tail tape measure protein [Mycolicibacterium smegmatis]MDF1902756.1 phage tail tape measure protein [Mycolicibacterium smegmatis]MDF1909032.1 phage tail tape measure protein [Mycolicibacterium smegmatis]MDF1921251.1 phage tail tape measure protein [Mycolicibacterium smegmatis]MDF1927516.1 phage tail tape measure protein [Mycolicibacterium smegmatis]UAK53372.1 phage tail tape measure protein [Mycolicibacterium smegmatis]